ncbi:pyrroloquinoline quinone biosynthesis peptide chaperone PqqD [Salinarimonas soli]|uniref:PqqA binding protein n=1 Tax=Salinarimonas soli TaxID=1638099 RepID=A0A5B2VGL9_9HYPH|nr:pyrroloquinoline quinone biosynthesis peptide chaperone PqqD [Salinarimonas soli]
MSEALTLTDVPRLPRGVRLRFDEVRGAHVLLAPERAFDLDAVAAEVLGLVDGTRSVSAIVDALAAKFDEDRAVIEGDVVAMLDDLAKKRVLDR